MQKRKDSSLLIKDASVVLPVKVLPHHNVLCNEGKITGIFASPEAQPVSADEVIDASGHYLAPGFIDSATGTSGAGKGAAMVR